MEERLPVCNTSIEAGARAGMIAPDETTVAYLAGRPRAPSGAAWERAVGKWRGRPTAPRAGDGKNTRREGGGGGGPGARGASPGTGAPPPGRGPAPPAP